MSAIRRFIPHLFTTGNLVGGMLAIVFTLDGELHYAPICIFISALFDLLDGMMARLLKVTSELGKQLDSLADMVTFGLAPGIFVYQLLSLPVQSDGQFHYFTLFGFLLPIAAMFRLAIFNLDEHQKEFFRGVPTPAMAIYFFSYGAILYDVFSDPSGLKMELMRNFIMDPYILILSTIFFSTMMVLPLRLFSLKFKDLGWTTNKIRYIFLTISAVLLATLFVWAIPLIILLYIVLSIINNFFTKSAEDEIQS